MAENNKQRLSISVSTETVELINESLKLEKFRNKSHVVEFSINKVLKGETPQGKTLGYSGNKQNSNQEIENGN